MKGTEKSKKAVYNLQIEEEFRKVATKFMKELKKVRQTSAADQQPSSMVKKVNAWKNFCLESEDWIPDNEDTETMPECEKVEEVTYEQMTLPFVEMPEEEPEVTQRYVYWHLRFNEMCRTLDYAIDGKSYVVVKDIEVEDILKNLSYGANIDYREYTRAELESQEMGFNSLNPCWNKYADFLHYLIKTDEEMFDMLMKEAFISTLSGGTCTNLMEDLLDIYELQTNMEWVELWAVCIYVSINTGLPMLRGYSREEYARRTGKNAFDIALIDEEVIVEHPDQGTQLYELPIDIQQKLYESVFTPDTAEKNIRQVLKEIGGDNEEIMFLLANNYMSAGQYAKAETVLKRLKRICTYEDFSIEELLKMAIERQKAAKNTSEIMDESHTDGFKQSFRRAEPKIGRNDPCPCGSGKKYKKCCGRNI